MFPLLQKLRAFPKAVLQKGAPQKIGAPEKELRFTRARQAAPFWFAGLFCLVLAAAILLASTKLLASSTGERLINNGLWALLPLALGLALIAVAVHLTRHAYIIFTPIGIEIFPLFFPSKNLNVTYWPEVEAIDFGGPADGGGVPEQMVISIAGGSKVFLTLAPIRRDRIEMLVRASEGRMADKK